RRAHDERVECVARVQPLDRAIPDVTLQARRCRVGRGAVRLGDDEGDARMAADALSSGLVERVEAVLREPVARKLVPGADPKVVTRDRDQAAWPDPVVENRRRQRASQNIEEAGPKVIQHGSHPHLRTGLSTCVDSPGHLTRSEYRAATRAPQENPSRRYV